MLIDTSSRLSGVACELRALIAIEDFRPAVLAQGVFQAIDAERGIHTVADAPGQHFTAVPVDDRHKIGKSTLQPE